jgi:hypothetical protein
MRQSKASHLTDKVFTLAKACFQRKADIGVVSNAFAVRKGCKRLDMSTQGKYTKLKTRVRKRQRFQCLREIISNPATPTSFPRSRIPYGERYGERNHRGERSGAIRVYLTLEVASYWPNFLRTSPRTSPARARSEPGGKNSTARVRGTLPGLNRRSMLRIG